MPTQKYLQTHIQVWFLVTATLTLSLLFSGCANPPPLSVVQRDSLVGEGKVLIITNVTNEFLHDCTIKIQADNGNEFGPVVFAATIKPHDSVEVGWMELGDWIIEPGEKVTISARDYGTLSHRILE